MIDESRVHAGQVYPRHMARDAILRCGRAGPTRVVRRGFLRARRCMASEALLVICAGIMIEGLVRVMACCAGEARIPIAPATTVLQPIRLKAHVLHAQYSRSMDFVPSTVTSAAKINLRNRPQIPWVENRMPTLCTLFIVHELCMFRAGTMTSFAIHSKYEARGIKSCPRCRSGPCPR